MVRLMFAHSSAFSISSNRCRKDGPRGFAARLTAIALCKASRLFHETLTRRQFMTERSCGRFDRERWRRIKTERHGRFGFHAP